MKTRIGIWTTIVALTLLGVNTADAQWYAGRNLALGYGAGLAYGGYGGGFSAQTPMSANAIGMSALVRSQGEYNLQTAQAATYYEKARSQYIDNQQKAYAARQATKRAGQARVAEETASAHASLARANEFQATHQPLPLPNAQLNPSTGHIEWPTALTTPEYADMRKALDEMFATRTKYGATANLVNQIEKKVTELKDLLRENITKIPLGDYSQARRFLDSMVTSARSA